MACYGSFEPRGCKAAVHRHPLLADSVNMRPHLDADIQPGLRPVSLLLPMGVWMEQARDTCKRGSNRCEAALARAHAVGPNYVQISAR